MLKHKKQVEQVYCVGEAKNSSCKSTKQHHIVKHKKQVQQGYSVGEAKTARTVSICASLWLTIALYIREDCNELCGGIIFLAGPGASGVCRFGLIFSFWFDFFNACKKQSALLGMQVNN